jgi:hypothetical protein
MNLAIFSLDLALLSYASPVDVINKGVALFTLARPDAPH